jgi:hypothetical protein
MIETISYVALNDPNGALPGSIDFSECRVTSPSFTKAMRVLAEPPIKVSVQDHSHHLSKKFVAPNGHIHSPLPPLPRDLRNG